MSAELIKIKNKSLYYIVFLLSCFLVMHFHAVQAQTQQFILKHSTATLHSDLDSVSPNTTLWLALELELQKNWHVYWKNPGDSGSPPELKIESSDLVEVGELQFHPPKRILISHLVNYGYYNHAVFYLPIKIPETIRNDKLKLTIFADWLICEEICIPEEARFEIILPVKEDIKKSASFDFIHQGLTNINSIPQTNTVVETQNNNFINIRFPEINTKEIKDAYLFFEPDIAIEPSQKQNHTVENVGLTFQFTSNATTTLNQVNALLEITKKNNQIEHYQISSSVGHKALIDGKPALTLELAVLFALIGGLLLNLMPCVFPILSLKVLSLVEQKSAAFRERLKQAVAYTAGILACFSAIAIVLIMIRASGAQLGWGFQMQSPLFLTVMIYILLWVALVLLDIIAIRFSIPGVNLTIKNQSPILESFATGLLITLISTPCTAPFMAPALGFALSQSAEIILLVLLALGFGLALPFLIFAIFPKLAFFIPRSGPWLNTFKQFLAFPMFATMIWLVWILGKQLNIDRLAILLLGLLAFGFLIWALKQIKQPVTKIVAIVVALGIIIYSSFDVYQATQKQTTPNIAFSELKLKRLLESKQKVFVNVTADWCINCKVNEKIVLSTNDIQQAFQKNNIVYLVADWTQKNAEVSQYLNRFQRYGVPLYVYYPESGEPVVLPQLLSKDIIINAIQSLP